MPEKELKGCVLKTKGPFNVSGVGGTSVKVNDEFMVTVSLVDGTRQIMEGWSIDRITDALPFVDLREAEREIKASQPDNKELQQLQCPPHIVGEVDVLMGILYQNIFPRAVHSLSNGLTIYEMRVTPHDPHFNAVIGGPHSSFRFMAQEIGGVAILFANLSRELENYKSYGPPQIGKALMSAEDFRFAKQNLEWGDENLYESIQEFNQIDDQMEVLKFDGMKASDDLGNECPQFTLACVDCGEEVSNNSANTLYLSSTTALSTKDDENETMLKQLQKAQSEGLSIEYRCPRCRSCNDCRRSFETERVSLREEAEDLMICDSVKIEILPLE